VSDLDCDEYYRFCILEGVRAFDNGLKREDNPHEDMRSSYYWDKGWYIAACEEDYEKYHEETTSK